MKEFNSEPQSFLDYISEIYKFRHLIITLGIRDLKSKYAQSLFGLSWSLIQPLVGLALYSFVFGYILKIKTGNMPYPIFIFTGISAWFCFTNIMGASGSVLIENKEMIKKIYFPKIILPLSKVFIGLVEFGLWVIILAGLLFYYGICPSWKIAFLPFMVLLDIITSLSVGLWLSALTYRKKDLIFIIPYLTGFGILITPIFYPTTLIPANLGFLNYCNPLSGIVEGFRWSILGVGDLSWKYLYGFIPVFILFITAFLYYRKIESKLADIV